MKVLLLFLVVALVGCSSDNQEILAEQRLQTELAELDRVERDIVASSSRLAPSVDLRGVDPSQFTEVEKRNAEIIAGNEKRLAEQKQRVDVARKARDEFID